MPALTDGGQSTTFGGSLTARNESTRNIEKGRVFLTKVEFKSPKDVKTAVMIRQRHIHGNRVAKVAQKVIQVEREETLVDTCSHHHSDHSDKQEDDQNPP